LSKLTLFARYAPPAVVKNKRNNLRKKGGDGKKAAERPPEPGAEQEISHEICRQGRDLPPLIRLIARE
jgi:hypothetical protein